MFIIDGHNLLWLIEEMGQGEEEISELQMCKMVGGYLKAIGETGEIIFDGTGPDDKSVFDNVTNLDVFFAGASKDADTVIEGKIKATTGPRELVIVSSDRRLRRAAKVRGATAIKSQDFWESLQRELHKKKTTREPKGKRTGLTEGETKQWLKFFGLDQ